MISIRQLCRRKPLNFGLRFLYSYSSSPRTASALAVGSEFRRPFLGFLVPSRFCRVIKPNDLPSLHYSFNASCFTTHAATESSLGELVEVPLAQTGEGIAECELLKWFVQEGDEVEEFQPLCEVQSDKATIEITSRYRGKISHILHAPGDIVKVGETLLKMAVEEFSPSTVSDGNTESNISDPVKQDELSSQVSISSKSRLSGILCTPAVRNLAKQHGIDINDIKGSGIDGRILKEDIINYASAKDVAAEPYAFCSDKLVTGSSLYEDRTLQLRGFQRAMVKSMTMAAKVPHFRYVEEIHCGGLVELKASFQNANPDPSIKHTFLPFLVKSLSRAINKYPLLNSCFNEDANEIIIKGTHNIGIAMATPYGLVVPNVKKVQSLSILEITKEISRLQQLATENKLSQDDISGGTITISNIGAIGGKFGSPLIKLPEVAIIAIGRIQKVPHFKEDGTVYSAPVMNVNIGADHRVLDGATVAKFCNEWKSFVEKPELLLLHTR
ncbi:lipoamide acyltransferase component of branched-chain alpha-keto acid dehydrogenase complex, mitochondrial-like [Chenopodium quinoa]|uniref:lipoamide acyltransferase component of branched-chain alpha-keto acid dehydrogenase complex, mitochondrial-like n=1 Tax=Chenopodium quinoa TaxID=63459 RepID=UPI000B7979D6|nr:lipoamide acyltransferase component of branched-chain alpha-keto acid dehydrogenase complex, mitochondrial-like [Chenopodium quinoa]